MTQEIDIDESDDGYGSGGYGVRIELDEDEECDDRPDLKAIGTELEEGNYYKALRAQLEYNEWLFELSRLSPSKQQIESVSVKADAAEYEWVIR